MNASATETCNHSIRFANSTGHATEHFGQIGLQQEHALGIDKLIFGVDLVRPASLRASVFSCADRLALGNDRPSACLPTAFSAAPVPLHVVEHYGKAADAQGKSGDANRQWIAGQLTSLTAGNAKQTIAELQKYICPGQERTVRLAG